MDRTKHTLTPSPQLSIKQLIWLSLLTIGASTAGTVALVQYRAQPQHPVHAQAAGDEREGLPTSIEFLSFSARQTQDNDVRLDWRVMATAYRAGFEVERSKKGKRFESIGFVASNHTQEGVANYTYVDQAIKDDQAFYRLRYIDPTGKAAYSVVAQWTYNPTATFRLKTMPNPAHESLFLAPITRFDQPLTFKLANPKGQVIWTTKDVVFTQTLEVPVKTYPAGPYTLQVSTASSGLVFSKQIIIQH